jgi:hypothetical protein
MRTISILLAAIAMGCTASAQTGFDYLDEARDRISMGHRKLAAEAIDNAEAWFRQALEEPTPAPDPDPEPDPDPDPPISVPFEVWTSANPAHLLLDKVNGGVNYSLLDNPKVDGLSLRIRWSTVQPNRNRFDFDLIDRLSQHARQRGKVWTLRIMAGTNSPNWLDCPTYSDGDGTFPLPWCPELKSEFDRLMLALGREYADDPLLVMVHVPGFDESAEMHMPKGRDWPTNEMIEAWDHRINVTAAAFPRQLICLNHSPEDWSGATRQWMMTLGKARACFQMNALKASTNTNWFGYTILDLLDQDGWNVGFQFVGPSQGADGRPVSRFGGPFSEGYQKGQNAGSRWYEFYQPDTGDLP